MSNEFKLHLHPSEQTVSIKEGQNILECLREQGVFVKSSCGGHATCGDCVVKIMLGQDHLNAPSFEELKLLGNVFHITKERLACQTCVTGDVKLDMTAHDPKLVAEKLKSKSGPNKKIQVRKKDQIPQKDFDKNDGPPKGKDGGYRKHRGFKKLKY